LFLLVVLLTASWTQAFAARKVALVIGNSAYAHQDKLENPANDAADMAAALARLGFEVEKLLDADGAAMRRALVTFGERTRGAEFAVIFFAGHGIEIADENYLIPIDARLASDTDAGDEAVSLKSAMLRAANATKLGMVILDSCRNNPFKRTMARSIRTRSGVEQGLKGVEPPGSVLVAYAAKEGTLADEGVGSRNSPFTAALLRHLETPGLEINFVFRRTRDAVVAATNRRQEPHVYGSLSGAEIYLKPAPVPEPPRPAAPTLALANPADATPAPTASPAPTVAPVSPPIAGLTQKVRDAIATARLISWPTQRAETLMVIGATLHRAGDASASAPIIAEALKEFVAATDKNEHGRGYMTVAGFLALIGRTTEALEIARSAADPSTRDNALSAVAYRLAERGEFSEALAAAASILTPSTRVRAKANIAGQLGKVGQGDDSALIFTSVRDEAKRIEPASARPVLLAGIAQALAEAGRVAEAIDLAASISNEVAEQFGFRGIGAALVKAGDRASGLTNFRRALDIARARGLENYRPGYIADTALAMAAIGFRQEALEALAESHRLAASLHQRDRDYAAISIVRAEIYLGLDDAARATAARVEDATWRQFVQADLVFATARAGNLLAALEQAAAIATPQHRNNAYARIVSALISDLAPKQ
jgi:hypothetical protein